MTHETTTVPPGFAEAFQQRLTDFALGPARGTSQLAAWFLGPKAENGWLFEDLIVEAVRAHCADRRELYPQDPEYVTDEMKQTDAYDASVKALRAEFDTLLKQLRGSVPAYSYRFQGHMNWDLTIPGMAGYFAAMLSNPNNVAAEASPVTTMLETAVGDDLCAMLGYRVPQRFSEEVRPWGHITCDGTVANLEAMWSARNLKYYPIALARAVAGEKALRATRDITVVDGAGEERRLLDLDDWELLNLPMDTVLALPAVMHRVHAVPPEALALINAHTIQHLGYQVFLKEQLHDRIGPPAVLAPSTMHYSWPKAVSLLGMGRESLLRVGVDLDARARMDERERLLDRCRKDRRPVLLDVAVVGSTELSAVDPLADIVRLREENARRKFFYPVHADAAWGGYFAAIKRPHGLIPPEGYDRGGAVTPEMIMDPYVNRQYDALAAADSVSIDPHKAGYVPYPAGGLCYRNRKQREMVTFTAPYVSHGDFDPSVGFYGVEGSKPGAAAAGVYLSHRVIRNDETGYGRILGQSLFNSKRLYAALVTMEDPYVKVVPCRRLPSERTRGNVEKELRFIRERIVGRSNQDLLGDKEAMDCLRRLGPDQLIIGYAFNFLVDGRLNEDVTLANRLNDRIYQLLSITPDVSRPTPPGPQDMPPMVITGSRFEPGDYGTEFVSSFASRLGLGRPKDTGPGKGKVPPAIHYLISTTMDPWLTDTAAGNFIPTLIGVLRDTARKAAEEIVHG